MTKIFNPYLKNLNRVEFIVTRDCTGACRHCSEGGSADKGVFLDAKAACCALSDIAREYELSSVMTFGGEPLLHCECVCEIHSAAKSLGIEKRQIITNGFFSRDEQRIKSTAKEIARCGANDILLSVDAFHQETIPIGYVLLFAETLVREGASLRLNPAWLGSRVDKNPYNAQTEEILRSFKALGIPEGAGNIIFPMGNAIKFLGDYFENRKEFINPYEEEPEDLKSVSIEPDGELFGKNINEENALEILQGYAP